MGNELVLFNQKFRVNKDSILNYLYTNTESKKQTDLESFVFCFTELYRLPILIPLLNAILTKVKHRDATFKVTPLYSWDRIAGHCVSAPKEIKDQESSFKKRFFSYYYTIMIKKIRPDIIIHEIAHSIERIAEIDLNNGFKQVLEADFKAGNSNSTHLKAGVKDVMETQLKGYKLEHHMSELFARFFEMLAMSYDVEGWGEYQFYYKEIEKYFTNTVKWTKEVLTPILDKKIDSDVKASSLALVEKLEPYKKSWVKNHQSKFANSDDPNKKWLSVVMQEEKHMFDPDDIIKTFDNKELKKLDNGAEYFEFKKKN